MSFDDPRDFERELGRPPIKDRGYYGRFIWWRRAAGTMPPDLSPPSTDRPAGKPIDFNWDGALVGLGLLIAFAVSGAVVLWVYR